MAPRILVVEDDPIACEVVERTLVSEGYDVVVAHDGIEAVELTKSGSFDLALIDYSLPEIDGLASARLIRSMSTREVPTTLVAITGNGPALAARSGADVVFDHMLSKPFAPKKLLAFVAKALRPAETEDKARSADAQWQRMGLPRRPKALCIPEPASPMSRLLATAFECVDRTDEFDLILLTDPSGAEPVAAVRSVIDRAAQVPVIDCTGKKLLGADAALEYGDEESWTKVAEKLKSYEARRATVNQLAVAGDPRMRLLASLYVSGMGLRPILDPHSRTFVCYTGLRRHEQAVADAAELQSRGFLKPTFVERFHCCPACDSRRLNVREECPSCRSSNLTETPFIHHFKCAYQGPEADFRDGSRLVCPKCRATLRHYGGDYEKPGSIMVCGQCCEWTSEPAVGFLCVDCSNHADGDTVATRDVHAYDLPEAAVAALTSRALVGANRLVLPSDVPQKLAEELERLAAQMKVGIETLAVVEIRYKARDALVDSTGADAFAKLRKLFIENLTGLLDEYGVVLPHSDRDYVVVDASSQDSLPDFASALIAEARKVLGTDLLPEPRIVDIGRFQASG